MSKKNASQVNAAKRTARAKAKAKSVAKARSCPQAIKQRKMRSVLNKDGRIADFDTVLEDAVMNINKGKKVVSEFKNTTDMINGIKDAIGQVFKLYSYVTFANELIHSKVIQHDIKLPLEDISRVLLNFDTRLGRIIFMNQTPEDQRDNLAIETEALDIGTNLASISEDLYDEVSRLEVHSIVIEDSITRLSEEVEGETLSQRRMKVLETIAHKYLAELVLADAEKAKQVPVAEEAPEGV